MSGIVGKNLGRGSGLVKVGSVGADAVDSANIADDAIDSEHYTDGSIDNAHIADNAIDSEHYADGSIDTAHIADNQITLALMAGGTDGQIITYDASGDPTAVGPGSDGQVLTSTGAGSPPAFEAAAGGGNLLQFQYTTLGTNDTSIASMTFTDITGASIAFTPTSASSKLLMEFNVTCNTNTTDVNNGIKLRFYSDTDSAVLNDGALDAHSPAYSVSEAILDYMRVKIHFCYVHPSWGTSAKTIKLQAAGTLSTDQIRFNRSSYGQYSLFTIKEISV